MRFFKCKNALAVAALGLAACGGGSGGSSGESASPTQKAAAASGPGTTDAAHCAVPYGDAPAALSSLVTGAGSGALAAVLNLLNQCSSVGGETLTWTDAANESRTACLFVPPNATKTSPMPLLVFLQGSIFPGPPQLIQNGWIPLTQTADLTGDPQRPGFILLLPIARSTHHYYPYPDEYALGWDNWYRNLDRSRADLNLDVAAIDQFTEQVKARDIVDPDRIYATGYSNGGAMAELYALNTPSIAATAVYSAPAPFSDIQDPCYQTPFATSLPPTMDIHNSCDIAGTCQTSTQFHQDIAALFPKLPQNVVIVDSNKQVTQACNALCASQTIVGDPAGVTNHTIWPQNLNTAMFDWLRDHPLSSRH